MTNGLILWLTAETRVTKGADDRVSQWQDALSGFLSASQSTGAAKPLWVADAFPVHPGIRFDGGQSLFIMTSDMGQDSFTIIILGRAMATRASGGTTHAGQRFVICQNFTEGFPAVSVGTNGLGVYEFGASPAVRAEAVTDASVLCPVTIRYVNRAPAAYLGGSLVCQGTPTSGILCSIPHSIGGDEAGNGFVGDIAEILIFNGNFTDQDRLVVEAWLQSKYDCYGSSSSDSSDSSESSDGGGGSSDSSESSDSSSSDSSGSESSDSSSSESSESWSNEWSDSSSSESSDSSSSEPSDSSSSESSESSDSGATYPSWWLKSVAFRGTGYHPIKKDGTDSPYAAPHWTAEAESGEPGPRDYPVLYEAGTKMSLVATWHMDPADGGGSSFEVKAECSDLGIALPETPATLSNGILSIPQTEVDIAFPDSVNRFDPMTVTWYIRVDGGAWEAADTSETPVYVCLKPPIGNELYRTVVHLACASDDTISESEAVDRTWDQFKGSANVTTWDNQPLYYYKPNSTMSQNVTTAKELLSSTLRTGQCGAWVDLFRLALRVNGIIANRTSARATSLTPEGVRDGILVKQWSAFANPPFYKAGLWRLILRNASSDMTIGHGGGNLVYGDLTNGTGLPGQNAATPSQKVFSQHLIVKYNNQYFDPSYGVSYGGAGDFQNQAIAGFIFRDTESATPPLEYWWKVYKPSEAIKIEFMDEGAP